MFAAVAWGAGLANRWLLTVLAIPDQTLLLLPAWREVQLRLSQLIGVTVVSPLAYRVDGLAVALGLGAVHQLPRPPRDR